ncbi:MAG: helix-turn-helix transcriptional regulator [Clostridiaceae bacterium]|nr:helix-turn-helix transcriptional regulator [Clostridiaceae bacterium]
MEEVFRKIRQIRKEKDLTLKELSNQTGLSVSFLSQVERGTSSLALTSLKKIADTLHVPITTFFTGYENENFLVKSQEHKSFTIEGSNTEYVRLSGTFPERVLESLLVTLSPEEKHGHKFSHHGEEFLYVLEGAIIVNIDGKEHIVKEGDSIHYPSNIPHFWVNPVKQKSKFLCVLTPIVL